MIERFNACTRVLPAAHVQVNQCIQRLNTQTWLDLAVLLVLVHAEECLRHMRVLRVHNTRHVARERLIVLVAQLELERSVPTRNRRWERFELRTVIWSVRNASQNTDLGNAPCSATKMQNVRIVLSRREQAHEHHTLAKSCGTLLRDSVASQVPKANVQLTQEHSSNHKQTSTSPHTPH
jgi:hypothetical protein